MTFKEAITGIITLAWLFFLGPLVFISITPILKIDNIWIEGFLFIIIYFGGLYLLVNISEKYGTN